MNTIIAGRFDGMARAQQAIDALAAAGFASERIASVAGKHGDEDQGGIASEGPTNVGSDESTSEENAGKGAITGTLKGASVGAAVGLIGFPVLGPIAPLGGAAVGAYVGSLAGALDGTDAVPARVAALEAEPDDGGTNAKSDMLVAVAVSSTAEQEKAVTVLRALGAAEPRSVEGNISGGQWLDFDRNRN